MFHWFSLIRKYEKARFKNGKDEGEVGHEERKWPLLLTQEQSWKRSSAPQLPLPFGGCSAQPQTSRVSAPKMPPLLP